MPKFSIGPSKAPKLSQLVPSGLPYNSIRTVTTFISNLCKMYDTNSFNNNGKTNYPILMGLSSSIWTQCCQDYANKLGVSFSDIDRNLQLHTTYCQTIADNFSTYQELLLANTTAGGTSGDGGCVFGPPLMTITVKTSPPSGIDSQVCNILRVLYTAGKFIGYFYQHHYVPLWTLPSSVPNVGGTNPTTWEFSDYQPTKTIPSKFSYRDLVKSLNKTGYPVSLTNSDISNPNWNIGANLYSQGGSRGLSSSRGHRQSKLSNLSYTSRGVDCTNFTKIVNYFALGLLYSSDTQNQAYGISGNSEGWANSSSLLSLTPNNVGFPTPTETGGLVNFTGQVLVNSSAQPWTDLSNTQILPGDISIIGPIDKSTTPPTLQTPTHGILLLAYPYVIDSDNFIGSYPGVFVRNILTAQEYYPNTIMNTDNVFIIRRFSNFNGNGVSAPISTYKTPMTDITQAIVVAEFISSGGTTILIT
jgi:hypothetical protein